MTSTATRRLRNEARNLLGDVENTLEHMAEGTGERLEAIASRADRRLRRARHRLDALESDAAARAQRLGRGMRDYVGEHPWIVIGGFAVLMLAAGALSRTRQ